MAGWPVIGAEVRVFDIHMNDFPRDSTSIGEIVARGDHIMEGYFDDAAATEAVMTAGWFHTGDMAVWDNESYVHIVDRKKDIIISGGENISSLEVEKAISWHPDVLECAVVSAPDTRWGRNSLWQLSRSRPAPNSMPPNSPTTLAPLLLARFKMPRQFEFVHEPLPQDGHRQNPEARSFPTCGNGSGQAATCVCKDDAGLLINYRFSNL